MEPVAGCLACELLAGARPLPGGRLAEWSGWVVEHSVGPLGLGTLVCRTGSDTGTPVPAEESGPSFRRYLVVVRNRAIFLYGDHEVFVMSRPLQGAAPDAIDRPGGLGRLRKAGRARFGNNVI
jgi:hypothetical protein